MYGQFRCSSSSVCQSWCQAFARLSAANCGGNALASVPSTKKSRGNVTHEPVDRSGPNLFDLFSAPLLPRGRPGEDGPVLNFAGNSVYSHDCSTNALLPIFRVTRNLANKLSPDMPLLWPGPRRSILACAWVFGHLLAALADANN